MMSYLGRRTLRQFGVALALVSASCHWFPADTTSPPAPPCPGPNVDTAHWPIVSVGDCGLQLKLPRKYKERGHGVVVAGSVLHTYRADFFNSIDIHFEAAANATLASKKTIRQNDYEGFTECNETIGGRAAILQSYRGGGSVTDGTREFRTYHAETLWQLKPGEFIRIAGYVTDRRSQEEILAAVRTVEFTQRSASHPNNARQASLFFAFIWLLGVFAVPLLVYFAVAMFGAFMLLRGRWRSWRVTQPVRHRVYLAAYLALVFTPSLLTDLFLFAIPAPAFTRLVRAHSFGLLRGGVAWRRVRYHHTLCRTDSSGLRSLLFWLNFLCSISFSPCNTATGLTTRCS